MASKKKTLDAIIDLIKDLPTSSKVTALAALGSGGTLLMAGNAAAGMWKVYQEVSEHRWFWEDHVTTGLKKLAELGLFSNTDTFAPAFEMVDAKTMRYTKRSDWYSNRPLTFESKTSLSKPIRLQDADPIIYLALGDSAAQGVGVSDVRDSYVALFASYLRRATQRRVIVLNISMSGAVCSTVVNRQLPLLHTLGITPDVITLDVGGNDTFSPESISVESFGKNLTIISRMLPIPSLILEVPPAKPLPQDKRAQDLNEALREVVEASDHVLVPVRKLGDVPLWKTLSIRAEDGFHPNADTYRLIAAEVARAMEPILKEKGWWQQTADDLYPGDS